jgi:2-polyprenyl-3-methyl-5-hydroxy-6-metoxy-1,4-benzoquinol methylase
MDQRAIKEYIRALEHMTGFLRTLLEEEKKITDEIPIDYDHLRELTNLRMLAKSDKWPRAVPEDLICPDDDEDQKLSRASGIVTEFIKTDVVDKKLCDFGCGEGHVPYVAAHLFGSKVAVGYDVLEKNNWYDFEKRDNLVFTDDFQKLKTMGPYDVILINDVIDHAENPSDVLKKAKSIKSQNGRIYMRCHPWTSRHATHLYKKLNKAYLHLIFSKNELYGMGYKGIETNKFIDPISEYKQFIEEAGLKIAVEETITHPLEIFFTHNKEILRRIKANWKDSFDPELASGSEFARDAIELQFIDYILV